MNENISQVSFNPSSVDAYIRHGWSLVPIPEGTKAPKKTGWNLRENSLKQQSDLPHGYGIGLAHAYSGTMALDIDNWILADQELSKHGINIRQLYESLDSVAINSGKSGHGKLLFKMPSGMTLPTKKVMKDGVTIYELRCATVTGLTVQDVLPPSIHPETKQPYQWAGNGHWQRLPSIPDILLQHWQTLVEFDTTPSINTDTPIKSSWSEIKQALDFIPPDCSRQEWIQVGMALHWAATQSNELLTGREIWNDWSRDGVKYVSAKDVYYQYSTFKSDKLSTVKLGTLFSIASRYGWTRPKPDLSGLFPNLSESIDSTFKVSITSKPPTINFDDDVPELLAQRAKEVGDSVGADPTVAFAAGLAAVCAVADARSRLTLDYGYKVPPVLWLMTIGISSDKKTPASKPMLAPLAEIEKSENINYKKELLRWEGQEAAYAASKKAYLEHCSKAENLLGSVEDAPPLLEQPVIPVDTRLTVNDVNSHKLVRLCVDRPRGLLCYNDEMLAWINNMIDRGSGENRSSWVVGYEANSYALDRVGTGTQICDNFAVAYYGNIQPNVLKKAISVLAEDGLLARFIPFRLDSDLTRLSNPVPEFLTCVDEWSAKLKEIYNLPQTEYTLSPDAYKLFREFQQWFIDDKRAERENTLVGHSEAFQTAHGKLEGLACRICFIYHLISDTQSKIVSEKTMRMAIRFVSDYVLPMLKHVYRDSASDLSDFDNCVGDYLIKECDKQSISLSDLRVKFKTRFKENTASYVINSAIMLTMEHFESINWIKRIDDKSQESKGIAEWLINPSLLNASEIYRKTQLDKSTKRRSMILKIRGDNTVNDSDNLPEIKLSL